MKTRKLYLLLAFVLPVLGLWLTNTSVSSQTSVSADLGLHKSAVPLTALVPGDEIQYTLTFSNAGVLTATEVVISETLPTLLTDLTVTSTLPLTPTGQAWAVGTLPPGAGGIITVTGTLLPLLTNEFTFTNTATITSPITDTQPANNTSFVVSEVNLPPLVVAGPNQTVFVGEPVTLVATFYDPGLDDTHAATLTWGDGLTETISSVTSPFTATHVYPAPGAFTVDLQVTDSDGGAGMDHLFVTVKTEIIWNHTLYLPLAPSFFSNPMKVAQVFPLMNSFHAPAWGNLSVVYGPFIQLIPDTITPASVILHSFENGDVVGSFSVSENQLTMFSERVFRAGETFQATLTKEISALLFGGGEPIYPERATVWQFQIATSDGSGYFLPALSPSFEGGNSTDLAFGDLDGDGSLDVIVANLDGPASVWVNDGVGGFSPHPTPPNLETGPTRAVALGDVDRDGDVDAVFATSAAEAVWLNDGQGNLSPHPIPTFGGGISTDLALGDLNGDGFLDVVVANGDDEPETVWLNDGTGAFVAHPTIPAFGGYASTSIALRDVDGDFDLDVVVANDNGEPETVWLNDGTGAFEAHPTTPSFGAGNSRGLGLGDLDGDGDADAVVANAAGEPETVWVNDGLGNFSPHPVLPAFGVGDSTALALGDLEGDGDLDVVVANAAGEPETIWQNNGVGEMIASLGTPEFGDGDSHALALGDVDRDGDLEVLVANQAGDETLWRSKTAKLKVVSTSPAGNGGLLPRDGSILVTFDSPVVTITVNTTTFAVRGTSTGTYPGSFSFPAPNQVQFTPAFPFFVGEDLVVTLSRTIISEEGLPLRPYTFSLRAEASGCTGNLTSHPSGPFGFGGGWDVAPGDLDGDRDLDAVINAYGGYAFIWMNDGSGALISHTITATLPVDAFGTAFGDVDADGDLDAVFAGNGFSTVWLNDGTGGFTPHPTFPDFGEFSQCIDLQLADLDGDGDLDAVCGNWDGEVWLNDGTGAFSPHPTAFSFGEGEISDHFFLEDIDQDGDQDVVATMDYGATLWLNGGNGDFTRAPVQPDFAPLGISMATLALGDLDGDHNVDMIVGALNIIPTSIWLNDGAGHFSLHPTTPYIAVNGIERMNLGDMDGDGDLDALFATPNNLNALWVNDGLGNFTPHPDYPTFGTEGGYVVGVGDLDGDGDVDVILTGYTNSSVYLNQNE